MQALSYGRIHPSKSLRLTLSPEAARAGLSRETIVLESLMEIFKDFSIESAHRLPNVPEGHKCARLHGHSFRIRIFVEGPLHAQLGWVTDFADIKSVCKPIEEELDHRYLNEIPGLENPTSENLARWIWQRLKPQLPGLSRVQIMETCTSGCEYTGD